MKVTEISGACHVFTLADGSTFRVFPRQEGVELKDSLISEELRRANGKYVSLSHSKREVIKTSVEPVAAPESQTKKGGKLNNG